MSLARHTLWILVAAFSLMWGAACTKSSTNSDGAVKSSEATAGSEGDKRSMPVKPSAGAKVEIAILAGGCFWGMEDLLREIPGVIDTEVGYTGGNVSQPSYEDVKKGSSGHAEAVRVEFDPAQISYANLLEKWFFRMHDPTTKNRQGNDVGTQYRSAIFATTPAQKRVAKEVIARVNKSGKWAAPVVTEVVDAGPFTAAEDYHQDYLEKNPGGYTCHFLRDWEDA